MLKYAAQFRLAAEGGTIKDERPQAGHVLHRTIQIDRAVEVDREARTVEIAFSSETPIERGWWERWFEILDHSSSSVRLERLDGAGAPLLVNHDTYDQVGVIESARIDADRVGRAIVRFGRSARAEEIFQDVIDGIRRLVSVGYLVHEAVLEQHTDEGPDTYRIIDWEPVENSLVPVPADLSVGVGRSATQDDEVDTMPKKSPVAPGNQAQPTVAAPDGGEGLERHVEDVLETTDTTTDTRTDEEVLAAAEREREAGAMRALGKRFKLPDEITEGLIAADGTMGDLKRAIRNRLVATEARPVPSATDTRITGGRPRYKALKAFKAQGEEAAYRAGMWARAAFFGDGAARSWIAENGVKGWDFDKGGYVRAGVEGIYSKGGAIVPDEMSMAIIDLREEYGIARSIVRVMPMSSDHMIVPRRAGGVTAYFVGENTEPTASDKAWNGVELTARKLGAQCKFSSEYAEDAIIDVAEDLASEIAYAFAEKEDDCLFNGDGTSTYGGIVGVLVKIVDGNHGAGAVDAASGIDTFAEVTQADLDSAMAALPQYAAGAARWYGSRPCKVLVWDALAAAAGGNTVIDLGNGPIPAYYGYPQVISQKMPTSTGDLSNLAMMLFGDLSLAATMGDRRGFRTRLLEERYAELDQLAVVGFERFDINVHDLGDGTTAGPVVALVGE